MKDRIFTAIFLMAALFLAVNPASAASWRTRLTLVVNNSTSPSHEVSPDLLDDDGVFTGSHSETQTHTDELGRSITETVTEFANADGELLMSADVAITARSEDFTVKAGEIFSEIFSVDVEIRRFDEAYDSYAYSLDIAGLPVWLKAEGELVSSDRLSTDITIYHHEFTISGRHESPDKAGVTFTAIVLISGDWPPMRAMGSKDVKITAEEVPKPPDEEPPEEVPTESPDMRPKDSPDVKPTESPDVKPTESPDMKPTESPDVKPTESPDVKPESPDVKPESPDIKPESPDISPDIRPSHPDKVPDTSQDISPDVKPVSPDNPPEDTDRSDYLDTDSTGSAGSISEILGNLTPEQIQAVRVLKVDGNITDLAGLEAFTNLERLDLTETALGSADLRGLKNLKSIDIAGNASITSLNLSGTGIQTLDAQGCTSLEQLDVSGCTSLQTLDVSNTPVKTLNAEDCTSLEVLDCSNCQLEELNLSGCDSLNVLDCSNNKLHKLDAYTFSRLDTLLCSNQQITGWKLSRLFSFVDYFVQKVFTADDSSVSDLGLENITNLRAWDADGQELTAKYDPETGWAEFSGVPVKMTYDYITGFEGVLMDVTVFASEYESIDLSRSCGGCSSGFTLSASGIALTLLLRRRKRF